MSNINDTCNWQQCTENPLPWFWGNICPWLLKLLKAILSYALVTEGSSWCFKHLTNVVWLNKMDRIQCKPTIVPWYNWPPCWIGCIYVIYGATKCNYAETAVQHNFSFSLTNCNWPTGFHGYIKTRSKIALNSARSLRTKSRVKELPVDRSGFWINLDLAIWAITKPQSMKFQWTALKRKTLLTSGVFVSIVQLLPLLWP